MLLRQCDAASAILTAGALPLTVTLPNNDCLTSIGAGTVAFPYLSEPFPVYIFPDSMLEHSLLSVSAFCNRGRFATFTKHNV